MMNRAFSVLYECARCDRNATDTERMLSAALVPFPGHDVRASLSILVVQE